MELLHVAVPVFSQPMAVFVEDDHRFSVRIGDVMPCGFTLSEVFSDAGLNAYVLLETATGETLVVEKGDRFFPEDYQD